MRKQFHCKAFAAFLILSGSLTAASTDAPPKGVSASDWQNIRQAYEAHRHAITPVDGSPGHFRARTPGQQLENHFDGRGFTTKPETGSWSWGLELRAYGQEPITGTATQIKADGQRLEYQWSPHLTEWWKNDRQGLEHGYTLAQRPQGELGTPLVLELATRGSLRPQISTDGLAVAFVDEAGNTVLNYGGLKCWDADGKVLASKFSSAGPHLHLNVDDTNARYPVTIDPVVHQSYLKARVSTADADDAFGISVAISGDTVVVGANGEDGDISSTTISPNNNAESAGAAYIFIRAPLEEHNGRAWTLQAYLKASNAMYSQNFGCSVAISGDTVVIGAYGEAGDASSTASIPNNNAVGAGAAYVFRRSTDVAGVISWTQQAYLKANNADYSDSFGNSVAISGDTIVVGAYLEDGDASSTAVNPNSNTPYAGAVYVFVLSGSTWSQQAYLKASNARATAYFGSSVAISGDTVVVGATGAEYHDVGEFEHDIDGAAYVFTRSTQEAGVVSWSQEAYLTASNIDYQDDEFGVSVAISGDTVVVGAPGDAGDASSTDAIPNSNAPYAGAGYIFIRNGITWSQQAYLKANNAETEDRFGISVAISGDTVVVGAYGEDGDANSTVATPNNNAEFAGAAYIFTRSGIAWSQQAYLKASNAEGNYPKGDGFGISVSISGGSVFVGAFGESGDSNSITANPNNDANFAGAGYIFPLVNGIWAQDAYLKSGGTALLADEGDEFGSSVAISGNTIVISALGEDSSAVGINGNPLDNSNSITNSGAAYVFDRSTGAWKLQAYLKGNNTDVIGFGRSVDISGNTIVVGADSQTEVGGSVFVFIRNGNTWSQQAVLKASNAGYSDLFGACVAISGNSVVVGAPYEDGSATAVNGANNNSAYNAGAAYIFVRSNGIWTQQAYLKAGNTGANDEFGLSVAISGDTVVVGAPYEDGSATTINGTSNNNAADAGAAYVFVRNPSTSVWSRQAYLKPNNTSIGDRFGLSVAISGGTVVVGSPNEDGSATTINGPNDNNANSAGAAYVFVRNPSTAGWSQQAYLKASNADPWDWLGSCVAIEGDKILVSAPVENEYEDYGYSGAVYYFIRSGSVWSQVAYIKGFPSVGSSHFGSSIDLDGSTALVGQASADNRDDPTPATQSDNRFIDSGAVYTLSLY